MEAKTRQRMVADDRRSQLVDAATRLISHVGYRQFTIARLARECGLTRAGVLHHFPSREDVLLAVLTARDLNDAAAVLSGADAPGDARTVLDLLVRRNMSQPEIVRLYTVLSAEALDPQHPAHEYFIDRFERAVAMLAELLGGSDRPGRELAIEVYSYMDGLQLSWLRDPGIDFAGQWASFADDLFARHCVA
jgi:AcrR family transcriptional regulator